MVQTELEFPSEWGGKREGAGRKPRKGRRRVAHRVRPRLPSGVPVHVTVRVRKDVRYLRRFKLCRALRRSFLRASKNGFRVCQFSVQGNHMHLVCEARDAEALSRGMQGLNVSVARTINRLQGRRGSVFADRYHAVQLRSPRQVRAALCYVLHNAKKHGEAPRDREWIDPFSSARYFDGWKDPVLATAAGPPGRDAPVRAPRGWLLRDGWRRHGLIRPGEVPGRRAAGGRGAGGADA